MSNDNSKINHKFNFVEGPFDMTDGKIISIKSEKYCQVDLCFRANMHVPFAKIKLYSRDLYVDAKAVLDDADRLGKEIERRWNDYAELRAAAEEVIKLYDKDRFDFGLAQKVNELEKALKP